MTDREAPPPPLSDDSRFMAAALALGRRGLGVCAPNPAVGALIVNEGVVVGRGWTRPGGRPHAETEALREAGGSARGATLYATLEPCSHHGATPPCAEAIVAAGISRVVFAVGDPDPRVAGGGEAILAAAGISVTKGILENEARRANLGHMLRIAANRPMVTLKLAMTSDLYAAGSHHDPRLVITGAAANGLVHMMRAMHDAIMVGSGTILADDSLLSVRLPGLEARKPLRIVLDSELRLRIESFLVATARDIPSLVIAGEGAGEDSAARLRGAGVEVEFVPRDASGRVSLHAALELLAARGLTRIFSEGGPRLAAALIEQGLADEVNLLTSPKPLGRDGVLGLSPPTAAILADAARYSCVEARSIGADRLARYERAL
ncbi:bifunctional diaminohydroxyphosphoribosylaminopyrimidine deaminase/5-amino-6-(5-phosphoribosylamino)uracil reductase RibD [Methylocapsa palsarum]|uniref:Riboflavin biosynthesis protein RibD n=1 Tax=Methylocapsa palsarum TaxID=1612308 RepID=A0A1I3W8A0_9HYPH|nr:bifunctional diaminohydroxyphosphoribosylaminopyrimidine deaminase/5-amino-6-(5-phosphoribosylamino)uracil reductase RibD [Methylocapsa palsarum]SFK02907.1 diaminohydroxyphosphoribosylaminopyrimidine deaminase / 5-amino-6-(5-phosphoribosylamino)uracil reductase [Methylocapsa palsarum]